MTTRIKSTPKVDAAPTDTAVELADTELDAVAGGTITIPGYRDTITPSTVSGNTSAAMADIKDGTSNTFFVGERSG